MNLGDGQYHIVNQCRVIFSLLCQIPKSLIYILHTSVDVPGKDFFELRISSVGGSKGRDIAQPLEFGSVEFLGK